MCETDALSARLPPTEFSPDRAERFIRGNTAILARSMCRGFFFIWLTKPKISG